MFDKEAELVDDDFLSEGNTYNLKRGGFGGWDHINVADNWLGYGNLKNIETLLKARDTRKYRFDNDVEYANKISNRSRINIAKAHLICPAPFTGKTHSSDTKIKMSISHKGTGKAENNSQYGTCWITNI